MISSKNQQTVVTARDYQKIQLDDYIDNARTGLINYTAPNDETIRFSICPFIQEGFVGNYDDVFRFITEHDTSYLISRNQQKLVGLAGYMNRISN
jgi:hypothetical protein